MSIQFPAYRPTSWELQLPNYQVITNSWRATEWPEILGSLPENARLRLRYENVTDQQALELLLLWRATAGGYYPLNALPTEVAAGIDDAALTDRVLNIAPLSWVVAEPPRQDSVKNLRSGVDIELKTELRLVPSIALPTVNCPIYVEREIIGCVPAPPPLPQPVPPLIGDVDACVNIACPGASGGVAVHPSGEAVAVAVGGQPYMRVFPWNDNTRTFGAAYANPSVLPAGTIFSSGFDVAFSPSGNAVIVTGNFGSNIAAYEWINGVGFGAKLSTPTLPGIGVGNSVAFHPSGQFVAFAIWGEPFIVAYEWNDLTGIGDQVPLPSTPVNIQSNYEGRGVAFSPDGTIIALAHDPPGDGLSPSPGPLDGWLVAWKWDQEVFGFGDRITGFVKGSSSSDAGQNVVFSPDGSEIVVVGGGSGSAVAFAWAYPISAAGFGAKYTDAAIGLGPDGGTWPSYTLFGIDDVAFSPRGDVLSFAQSGDEKVYSYEWTAGVGFTAYRGDGCLNFGRTGIAYSPISGTLFIAGQLASSGVLVAQVNSLYSIADPP